MVVLLAAPVSAQISANEKQPLAENVFKNIQVLKGIPVSEFMATMGFFSASLGLNCVYCHTGESLADWDKFAEDVPRKRTARNMIQMVNTINRTNFGGRQVITCNSCHNGTQRPKSVPSLAIQYSTPEEDPNDVEIPSQPVKGLSADEVINRYIRASGGTVAWRAISSLAATGKYDGYETYHEPVVMEIYAKAPNQLTTIVQTQNGTITNVFDGGVGWVASPQNPLPLLPLAAGAETDGSKLDAALMFPPTVSAALTRWRSGFPETSIGKTDVQVIQGTGAGGTRVKLYFDKTTGLLIRQLRYSNTLVGINPIQVDYEDYRSVGSVKLPFRWTVTWTNGQSNYQIDNWQLNAAVDSARFQKPAPAIVKPMQPVAR